MKTYKIKYSNTSKSSQENKEMNLKSWKLEIKEIK